MVSSTAPIHQLPLAELCTQCGQQVALYHKREAQAGEYCFEVARRALIEKDGTAWECFLAHFKLRVEGWVRQHPKFRPDTDEVTDFVQEGFMKLMGQFFQGKRRWEDFDSLSPLLKYLQNCVNSSILDKRRHERATQALDPDTKGPPLKTGSNKRELWAAVDQRLKTEPERVAFKERHLWEIKPQEIARRHPHLFADALAVSHVLSNILERLRRDPDFRERFRDWDDAE